MSPSRFRFLASARNELLEAIRFYEGRLKGLGAEFASHVHGAIEHLVAFPETGTPVTPRTRRWVLPTFPYTVVYLADGREPLTIIAVAHQRRRPGYWLPRRDKMG